MSIVLEADRALLEITAAIAAHRSLAELLDELAGRLSPIVGSELVLLFLHDEATDEMRLHLLGAPHPHPGEVPVVELHDDEQCVSGHVWETQETALIERTDAEARFPVSARTLREHGIGSAWFFPLTTPRKRLGAIGFAGSRPGMPTAADQQLLTLVAKLIALAV